VKFKIVQVKSKIHRNSMSSVRTVSTSPVVTNSVDAPMLGGDDNFLLIRPELLQKRTPSPVHLHSNGQYSSTTDSFQSSYGNFQPGVPSVKRELQQKEMFELIKTYCSNSPSLFKKLVEWGMEKNLELGMSEEEAKSLSEGRLWITAQKVDEAEDKVTAACSLDDIKGAYQKVGDIV